MRRAYGATAFAAPSASLVKLIQSGRMEQPGYALPRAIGTIDPHTEDADGIIRGGRFEASTATTAPVLGSMRDFMLAFLSTIGPALFQQQEALVDWFALALTLVRLDAEHDWATARAYLAQVLADRVRRDLAFAEYDRNMVDAVQRAHIARTSQQRNFGAGTGGNGGGNAHSARPVHEHPDGRCMPWNRGQPCPEPCSQGRKHECHWKLCKDRTAHRAKDCPDAVQREDGVRGGGSRGGRASRGGHGGGRGGSTAGAPSVISAKSAPGDVKAQ